MGKRFRVFLVLMVWLATLVAAVFWFSNSTVQHLAIGGGPRSSESFQFASALQQVINHQRQQEYVELFETGGTAENLRLLQSGRIDMAEIQGDAEIPDGIVAVARLYPDAFHLIVNEGRDIENFSDLKGFRVAIPPQTSGQNASFWFLAQHFGLAADSFLALPMDEAAANFAMVHGQVDAIFRVRSPGNNVIRELVGDFAMKIIPIDQGRALHLQQPALKDGYIPVGSYRGYPPLPSVELPTVVLDRLLVTRADIDDEVVYNFTRDAFENRADLQELSPLAGFMEPLAADAESIIPTHPGARRYFDREKPGFVQQNVRLASAALYTLVICVTALIALRSHWQRLRRVRMGHFNHRLMDIASKVRDEDEYSEVLSSKHLLMDMLNEVILDLDKDKVSQAEFEHFSFAWQAVDALVRDRLVFTTQRESV